MKGEVGRFVLTTLRMPFKLYKSAFKLEISQDTHTHTDIHVHTHTLTHTLASRQRPDSRTIQTKLSSNSHLRSHHFPFQQLHLVTSRPSHWSSPLWLSLPPSVLLSLTLSPTLSLLVFNSFVAHSSAHSLLGSSAN